MLYYAREKIIQFAFMTFRIDRPIFRNPIGRCEFTFKCADPDKIVTFKFNRFTLEQSYDYMVIGNLSSYQRMSENCYNVHGQESNEELLILDTWDTAKWADTWQTTKWAELNFLFERNISKEYSESLSEKFLFEIWKVIIQFNGKEFKWL